MRNIILSLIWMVVAAIPTLDAQQTSPSQSIATQQPSKAKATGTRPIAHTRVQLPQTVTGSNNPGRDRRIAANSSKRVKPADNNHGNGNKVVNNGAAERTTKNNGDSYADARRRHHHERHDCNWWKQHYVIIVLVGRGYYYWDSGYWHPAWGYDPNYERYEFDGPIYTYGNLLPDQVILNVQSALKQLGYFAGDLNGSLGVETQQALAAYQQANGLDVTGAVDEATVRALGLI